MNRATKAEEEMRAEYDIRGGVRGKYYQRYRAGTNIVLLDRDVAAVFRDSAAVNHALRLLLEVATASASVPRTRRPAARPGRPRARATSGKHPRASSRPR